VTPTADEDGEVCLHTEITAYDGDPTHGACVDRGEEFGLRDAASDEGDAACEAPADELRMSAVVHQRGPAKGQAITLDFLERAQALAIRRPQDVRIAPRAHLTLTNAPHVRSTHRVFRAKRVLNDGQTAQAFVSR
jgi:hypothetical protein